jgi:glycosyltransferase involved in cell wall biosynthesis
VVEPDDAGAIAKAANQLLGDPKLREAHGRAGIERVERYFSVEKMADSIISVCQDVVRL